MHGEHKVKLINAQQAKPIYHYQNFKEKIHKTKASIWFNKICKTEHLTPNYIHITVKGTNEKGTKTKNMAIKYRLNQEISNRFNLT
jgi:hypothetical protein